MTRREYIKSTIIFTACIIVALTAEWWADLNLAAF